MNVRTALIGAASAVSLLGLALTASTAEAQSLLRDDFNDVGIVDPTVWRLPFGSEGTFVGRTQYRGDAATDMPLQGVVEPLADDDAVLEIHLDTFSPVDPGNQFLGTDLLTKRNFARGGGLSFEARMRLKPTSGSSVDGGLVNGLFLFDVTRDSPPGTNNLVRDEIDWELISNQTVGAATQDPTTNFWNEGPFAGPGAGGDLQFHDVAGLDLTQFQTYRVDWSPQSIKWYVNDQLVRTQTTDVPDDPMKLHVNLWAPDSGFSDAFNSALTPVGLEGDNVRYTSQIDHVEVSRFDTAVSDNLLTDGSFETTTPTFIGAVPTTTTDTWLSFGNVFIEEAGSNISVPATAPDGTKLLKMFGPFNGQSDASGVLQNVVAAPGDEFEASVEAITLAIDSIAGNENFNSFSLSFLDAGGNVIQEAFADPGNIVDTNANDFPLLDGRDPNLVEETFVNGTVSAIAPDGTAFARLTLLFVQIANQGGSSFFDDAQLVRLTQDISPTLPGDFNRDGVVDAADYTIWRDASEGGSDASALGANGNGDAVVDVNDYNVWAGNFGATDSSTSTAVPEPTTVVSLVLAAALAAMRRR